MRQSFVQSALLFITVVYLFYGCTEDETLDRGPGAPIIKTGSYYIYKPAQVQRWKIGTTDTIRWTTDKNASGYVSIYLCEDTVPVTTLTASTLNDGIFTWYVNGISSGGNYRIRIADEDNEDSCDYSAKFAIYSDYSGSIIVSSPSKDTVIRRGTNAYIRWSSTGTVGNSFKIQLYNDTSLVSTISNSTTNAGSYYWYSSSSLSSGANYRIKVSSYTDPSIYGYSDYFRISSQYEGTITVTSPSSSSTWSSGSTYTITWITDGDIGSYVNLALYSDSEQVISITTNINNSGTYLWTVPVSIETGEGYSVRVSSYYDSGIYGYSDTFSISGLTPDPNEPDNNRTSARPYDSTGVPQQRSITYDDQDWIKFTADSGMIYTVSSTGKARVYLCVYRGSATSCLYSGNSSSTAPYPAITRFTPLDDSVYYVCVTPYSSYYGDYTLTINKTDPATTADFTTPSSSTTWSAGSTYTIQWKPDTTIFGNYVSLVLYDNQTSIMPIVTTINNSGTYSWFVPGNLASSNTYRIKIINSSYQSIIGYSQLFAISGAVKDQYEPDDSMKTACTVATDGTVYNRTITYNDVDWMRFTQNKGSMYVLASKSTSSHYLYLYNKSGGLIKTASGSSPSLYYTATDTGYLYAKVYYSTSSSIDYSFSIKAYNPGSMVTFTNPTSNATWSSGSSYPIQWAADTVLFSKYIRMWICKDTGRIQSITSYQNNSGSYSWIVPAGIGSGSNYRIRMENYNNSDVFGYSSQFSISGMPIDNYEPDDSIKQAKLLVPGSAQEHTLPTGDVDWFSIAGDAGRLYTIGTTGTTDTRMELYNQSGATKLVVDDTSGPGENAKISWYCVQGGTYNLKVFSSYYGPYTIQSSAFDSTEFRFSVSSPVDGDSFTVGDTCTISWNSGVSIGGAVDIFLYNTSGVVSTIQANTSSAGIYRWIIPLALAAASDYRIKIISRTVGDIFGFSNIFTIGK